jgi:hypothetical protein
MKIGVRYMECEDANWIEMACSRPHWWALVNTMMSFIVP